MALSTPLVLSSEATSIAGDWWRGAVIYEVYIRSFFDSNNDGVGDLNGVTSKLEYLCDLGVDAIWLTPFFKSPMRDFGYDVSDYEDVDPLFGSLADFDQLITRATALGLRVIVDLVFNHTSDRHAWFFESRESRTGPKANWYVWYDPKPDGTPPNNWLSVFGGPAWTWNPKRRQYYLHCFLKDQPDLNFHNQAVQDALLNVTKFWLDRGVKGLRLDAANFYLHDLSLRDNPPWPAGQAYKGEGRADNPYYLQQHRYDKSQPENLEFLRKLRRLLDQYPGAIAIGEIADDDPLKTTAEYIQDGVLHTAYNFSFLGGEFSPKHFADTITGFEIAAPDGWPSWTFSNHDVTRVVTRWGGNRASADAAESYLALLLATRGTVFLYQGEELGFPEADLAYEDLQDPYGVAFWPEYKGRDGCRTPMVWDADAQHGGFSTQRPWLPVAASHLPLAVNAQQAKSDSVLQFVRKLLAWRRAHPVFRVGQIHFIDVSANLLTFERQCLGQSAFCAFNFGIDNESLKLPVSDFLSTIEVRASRDGAKLKLESFGVFLGAINE